jgi:hypothetical protein
MGRAKFVGLNRTNLPEVGIAGLSESGRARRECAEQERPDNE